MSVFQNLSKTIRAKQILFIVDACYSGIIGSYSNMTISGRYDKNLRSRQIMTAGRSGQKARMYPSKQLSVYTYYLVRALELENNKIRADHDNDGEVTLWDLQSYVEKKVSQHTREAQTPRVYNYTEDDGLFVFKSFKQISSKLSPIYNQEKVTVEPEKSLFDLTFPLEKTEKRISQPTTNLGVTNKSLIDPFDGYIATKPVTILRSTPEENLSKGDVKVMLENRDFYSKKVKSQNPGFDNNKGKGFDNEFRQLYGGEYVIVDYTSMLMWKQSGEQVDSFEDALNYIDELNNNKSLGFSDWRLPTLEESMSLMKRKKVNNMYLDPIFDQWYKVFYTCDKEYNSSVWIVNYGWGHCSTSGLQFSWAVREVRTIKSP